MKNTYAKTDNVTDSILRTWNNKVIMKSANNLKDLFDTVKELDIVYQDGQIIDEHIRISKYLNIVNSDNMPLKIARIIKSNSLVILTDLNC